MAGRYQRRLTRRRLFMAADEIRFISLGSHTQQKARR
jgi:hypothetical protein